MQNKKILSTDVHELQNSLIFLDSCNRQNANCNVWSAIAQSKRYQTAKALVLEYSNYSFQLDQIQKLNPSLVDLSLIDCRTDKHKNCGNALCDLIGCDLIDRPNSPPDHSMLNKAVDCILKLSQYDILEPLIDIRKRVKNDVLKWAIGASIDLAKDIYFEVEDEDDAIEGDLMLDAAKAMHSLLEDLPSDYGLKATVVVNDCYNK